MHDNITVASFYHLCFIAVDGQTHTHTLRMAPHARHPVVNQRNQLMPSSSQFNGINVVEKLAALICDVSLSAQIIIKTEILRAAVK